MLSICDPEVDALKEQAQSVILWDADCFLLRVSQARISPRHVSPLASRNKQYPVFIGVEPMIKHPFLCSPCPLHQNNPFVRVSIDTPRTRLALTSPNTVIILSPVSHF